MTRDRGLEEDNPNEKTVRTSNDGTPLDVKPSDNGSGQGRHEHAVSKDEVDDTTLFYNLNKEKAGSFTAEMEDRVSDCTEHHHPSSSILFSKEKSLGSASLLILLDDAHTLIGGLSSWKWLHIICVILTFIMAVPLAFFLPNSPVEAKWLSTAEKVHTIKAIRDTQSGIKNSTWKWSQVREAFTDPKSWLFIFHMFFNELPNNTSQQLPLIIVGFGFTPAESALFNIAKPLIGSFLVLVSAAMLYGTRLGTGYTCAISYIPCFVGGIIELAAPWSNKIALVVGTQISTFKPSYLLGLSWAGTATTGYTKKLTVMSTCVVAASAANMISPEFWQPKYKPRYTLPWAFMTAFWFISPAMCLVIRWYLVRENRRRQANLDADGSSDDNDVLDTGDRVVHVYKEDLDLTDRQNQKFIYPL
ncbi:putative transporter [Colletotrichum fructicola Nara gc5]|uniref:Putative transporter n=1 Tax=Colletotrichum fructicola (strain Nara gc5) TaxID=1213859 RepID=A0A7J6IJD3_COLFN|nr:putative transporter [Colletotrichum fructicola]KAF4476661.1 putative transporter [Colletotrichum fructicola Nara gc5]